MMSDQVQAKMQDQVKVLLVTGAPGILGIF